MRWAATQVNFKIVGQTNPAYRQQLRLKLLTEDAPAELLGCARISAAPQCAVDVDRAASHDFGTRTNRAHDDEITFVEGHSLTGPDGLVNQHRRRVPRCGFAVDAHFTVVTRSL